MLRRYYEPRRLKWAWAIVTQDADIATVQGERNQHSEATLAEW